MANGGLLYQWFRVESVVTGWIPDGGEGVLVVAATEPGPAF